MLTLTSTARFPGTTLAEDRDAIAADLPRAQGDANEAVSSILQRFTDEAEAVQWFPDHPTLTWFDQRETARVQKAMQAAWGTFLREMGRGVA